MMPLSEWRHPMSVKYRDPDEPCPDCQGKPQYDPWLSDCCYERPIGEVNQETEYTASGTCGKCKRSDARFTREPKKCERCKGE